MCGFLALLIAACGESATAPDAATPDASMPDATAKDSTANDTGTNDSASTCQPEALDAFAPKFVPPSMLSVCTSNQIQGYYTACIDANHTTMQCNAFRSAPANASCIACLITPFGSSAYGATMAWHNGDSLVSNVAGCVATIDGDESPTSCAAKFQAWVSCQISACMHCDPGHYLECQMPAATGACGAYEAAAQCELDGKYSPCHGSFQANFLSFGAVFCGAGSSDASTD
jgi:hypothetical protein